MARGITQDQVDEAASAILSAGENPTVEKIRAQLGTGSPNTITRMLDAWRSQLGSRLRQLSALPEVPDAVGQAMIEVWRLAADHAERVLEARFASGQAALEAAQNQLAQERENWAARLETAETSIARAETARGLAEHACATLDGQLQDSHALRADLVLQRNRLQSTVDELRASVDRLQADLAAQNDRAREELQRQIAHTREVENRAHQEVDRARQEIRDLKRQRDGTLQEAATQLSESVQRERAIQVALVAAEKFAAHEAGRVAALQQTLAQRKTAAGQRSSQRKATAPAKTSGSPGPQRPRARGKST